jgi:protein-L-isoaspartate(D-aspartate) O-methyltransferase
METKQHAHDIDFEQARFNMVEQQIRPWDVLDPEVLELMMTIKRENFVPAVYRGIAFADVEIPLTAPTGKADVPATKMWAPKIEAKILQELGIKKNERVLEIGTGSGFFAALLAAKASEVISVEIDKSLAETAKKNLAAAGINNVRVEVGCGAKGWPTSAPYDVIVVTCAVEAVPAEMLKQLKVGGRLAAIVGSFPVWNAQVITQTAENVYAVVNHFETAAEPLRNAKPAKQFEF